MPGPVGLPGPVSAWAEEHGHEIFRAECPGEACGLLLDEPLTDAVLLEAGWSGIALSRGMASDILFARVPRLALAPCLERDKARELLASGVSNLLLWPCPPERIESELDACFERRWRDRFFEPVPRVCARIGGYREDYLKRIEKLASRLDELYMRVPPDSPGVVFGTAKPLLVEIRKEAVALGIVLLKELTLQLITQAPRRDPAGFALSLARLCAMRSILREHVQRESRFSGWRAEEQEMNAFRARVSQQGGEDRGDQPPGGNDPIPFGNETNTDWSEDEPEEGEIIEESLLPAFHSLALLSRLAEDATNAPVEDLVAWIRQDTFLCAQVLALANSPVVAPACPIEDVQTAVQLIGVQRVRRLASSFHHTAQAHRNFEGFDWRLFWMHQVGCADLAREAARLLHAGSREELHAMGLLHDLGKVVLSKQQPREYRHALAESLRRGGEMAAVERELLGQDHLRAGAAYARRHGLPAALVAAMEFHETPEAAPHEYAEEVALVSVANFLAKKYQVGFSGSVVRKPNTRLADQPGWQWIAAHLRPLLTVERFEEEMKHAAIQRRYLLQQAIKEIDESVESEAACS